MVLANFGTDAYGAQLSFNYDWEAKTSWFLLLTVVDGKKELKEFTCFADVVDAFEKFKETEIYRGNTQLPDKAKSIDNLISKATTTCEQNKAPVEPIRNAKNNFEKVD